MLADELFKLPIQNLIPDLYASLWIDCRRPAPCSNRRGRREAASEHGCRYSS